MFYKKAVLQNLSCKIAVIVENVEKILVENNIKFWLIRTVEHILLTIYN